MTQYGTRAGRRIVDLPTIAIDGGGTGSTTAAGAFDALKQAATDSYQGVVELATNAEAQTGTDTSRGMTPATTVAAIGTWGHAPDVIIEDQKASGTNGGTATSGSFQTRTLNTLVRNNGTLASLSTNQFTLPAGTYAMRAGAVAFRCAFHQTRLRNVTDSTDVGLGLNQYSATGLADSFTQSSEVAGVVTIAASKTFELQHRVSTTRATDGFGVACSFGTEVYARVEITKVA